MDLPSSIARLSRVSSQVAARIVFKGNAFTFPKVFLFKGSILLRNPGQQINTRPQTLAISFEVETVSGVLVLMVHPAVSKSFATLIPNPDMEGLACPGFLHSPFPEKII